MRVKKKEYIFFARDFQNSVFPQYMLTDLWTVKYKKLVGKSARLGFINRKKVQEYFIQEKEWAELQFYVHKKARTQKNFINRVKQLALNFTKKLNDFTTKEVYKKDLFKLSNSQLAKIYNKFYELDQPCYAYGNLVFIFEFGERAMFSNLIKEAVKKRQPKKIQEYYSLLAAPSQKTIFYEQSLDILKISNKICRDKSLKHLILNNSGNKIIFLLKKNYSKVYKEFYRQYSAYHWLFYSWEGPAMEIEDFIDFARDVIKRGQVAKELEKKSKELSELKKEQEKVMTRLNFNQEERWAVKMAQFAVWFQPFRKARQFKSCWHMTKYFTEVAKRLHLSVEQTRYLTHWEMAKALNKSKADADLINQRRQFFICYCRNNKVVVESGDKAEKFVRENIRLEKIIKLKELAGTSACPGKAQGKVRIVNSLDQAVDFKRGEILVSYATNPLLLPYMRQSAAIVTEEGGLTCHAAIVSRELNKPCVVGIKGLIANLKDGDWVEVDAAKGIVKKIK